MAYVFFAFGGIGWFYFAFVAKNLILSTIGIGLGVLFLCGLFKEVSKKKKLKELAESDPEQYKQRLRQEAEKQKKSADAASARIPACPICHSKTYVRRISNIDRTASTAVWGAASSSIGKQWECTSCNHKFNVDAVAPAQEPVRADPEPQPDVSEELRKYKQFLDDGLITQEDYDTKKRQLLGL